MLFVYAIVVTIRVIEDLNVRSRVAHRGIAEQQYNNHHYNVETEGPLNSERKGLV